MIELEAYSNRRYVYSDKGDYGRAISDYTRAIDLKQDQLARPYRNRGQAYPAKGDLLERQPETVRGENNAGLPLHAG